MGEGAYSIVLDRGRIPPDLVEPEEPWDPIAKLVLQSWGTLGTMRPAGMGPTCIPWDKVMYFGQAHGLGLDECHLFWEVVHQADIPYLTYLSNKPASKSSPTPPPSKPGAVGRAPLRNRTNG